MMRAVVLPVQLSLTRDENKAEDGDDDDDGMANPDPYNVAGLLTLFEKMKEELFWKNLQRRYELTRHRLGLNQDVMNLRRRYELARHRLGLDQDAKDKDAKDKDAKDKDAKDKDDRATYTPPADAETAAAAESHDDGTARGVAAPGTMDGSTAVSGTKDGSTAALGTTDGSTAVLGAIHGSTAAPSTMDGPDHHHPWHHGWLDRRLRHHRQPPGRQQHGLPY